MGETANGRAAQKKTKRDNGYSITPFFNREKGDVYDSVEWEISDARITHGDKVIFEQKDVEFPEFFSEMARRVVASKYFYGDIETGEREHSLKQLVQRVVGKIGREGRKQGYLTRREQGVFESELAALFLNQYASPNSPVWFNVGKKTPQSAKKHKRTAWTLADSDKQIIHETPYGPATFRVKKGTIIEVPEGEEDEHPQTSACFIQSVKDTMEDIMRLSVSEAMLFKHGSGTGTDLSTLRSSYEKLSGGGKPSGPLKYMSIYDEAAAVIKSGGKTRRAAKMHSLKDDHPDIMDFVRAKSHQEEIIRILVKAGINVETATESAKYQNTNLSVRVTDEFMDAVEKNLEWRTVPRNNPELKDRMPQFPARDLFHAIAEGTHACGDPGVQYHTTINKWHTCPNSGPINASNPCSEYMFVDDSSCNLASLNLMKFKKADGSFDYVSFERAIDLIFLMQEILYSFSGFPEKPIADNSARFRPIGMGFANLGALLMSWGTPYDSDEGRAIASAIASLTTARAYNMSSKIAKRMGAFEEFEKNKEPMLKVIAMHRDASRRIDASKLPEGLGLEKGLNNANKLWDCDYENGQTTGFRNAQATVIAPTGTIGFMMDCDTTGVEPDIALVKSKLLAGGGLLRIINQQVGPALKRLGYSDEQIRDVLEYTLGHQKIEGAPLLNPEHREIISELKERGKRVAKLEELGYQNSQIEEIIIYTDGHETVEGAPHLRAEHLPVFDCAFKPLRGKRRIKPEAHLRMMAAVQPFISGAISKTINLDEKVRVEEIEGLYKLGRELGLKAVAMYRDKSKQGQPVTTGKRLEDKVENIPKPVRRRLQDTRQSITHKFGVAGHEGYLTVGLYEDQTPGELFITMAKEGSTIGGLMDVIGTCTSMALQYGVPLITLVDKFRHARFEPAGMTTSKEMPFAKSIIDYIFCWLGCQFIPNYAKNNTAGNKVFFPFLETINNNQDSKNGTQLSSTIIVETKQTDENKDSGKSEQNNQSGMGDTAGVCTCGGLMESIDKCKSRCRDCGVVVEAGCGGG